MDLTKVERTAQQREAKVILLRQDQGHKATAQSGAIAPATIYTVEGERTGSIRHRQATDTTLLGCGRIVVTSGCTYPKLERREPIPAAIGAIEKDNLANLRKLIARAGG